MARDGQAQRELLHTPLHSAGCLLRDTPQSAVDALLF